MATGVPQYAQQNANTRRGRVQATAMHREYRTDHVFLRQMSQRMETQLLQRTGMDTKQREEVFDKDQESLPGLLQQQSEVAERMVNRTEKVLEPFVWIYGVVHNTGTKAALRKELQNRGMTNPFA